MGQETKDALAVNQITLKNTMPLTAAYTTTNVTTTRALNANVNDTLITSDVLCTLIEDLKSKGIIE